MDDPRVNSESDDAPSVLVRNDQYPVRPQSHRLISEQINAMKTIFRVTDQGGPGRSTGYLQTDGSGGKNPPNYILIYRYSDRFGLNQGCKTGAESELFAPFCIVLQIRDGVSIG